MALAMLDIVEQEDFPAQAAEKGTYLMKALQAAFGDHPHVGDIRGLGLMCALEFVADRDSKQEFDAARGIGAKIHSAGMERGMFSRVRGDVYCIAPPIVTEHETLDRIVDILVESTQAVLG